jgi:hypothetical protein
MHHYCNSPSSVVVHYLLERLNYVHAPSKQEVRSKAEEHNRICIGRGNRSRSESGDEIINIL